MLALARVDQVDVVDHNTKSSNYNEAEDHLRLLLVSNCPCTRAKKPRDSAWHQLREDRHSAYRRLFIASHHHVEILHCLTRSSLADVVDDRENNCPARQAVFKYRDEVEI
jgi:hypothetical protein